MVTSVERRPKDARKNLHALPSSPRNSAVSAHFRAKNANGDAECTIPTGAREPSRSARVSEDPSRLSHDCYAKLCQKLEFCNLIGAFTFPYAIPVGPTRMSPDPFPLVGGVWERVVKESREGLGVQ